MYRINQIDLHDSTILGGEYDEATQTLKLFLEISNWQQTGYKVNEPELLTGTYIFTSIDLSDGFAKILEKITVNEHVDAEILSCPTQKINDLFVTQLNFHIVNYLQHEQHFCYATLTYASCQWYPD